MRKSAPYVIVKPEDSKLLDSCCEICDEEIKVDEVLVINRGWRGSIIKIRHLDCYEAGL